MILLNLIIAFTAAFASGKAHQHGVASLKLASEANKIEVELEIPAQDIIGFEQEVKTDKQRQKLAESMQQLSQVSQFIKINTAANCSLKKFNVEHDLNKAKQHHYEFEVELEYFCANSAELKSVDVDIFTALTGVKTIDAKAISAAGAFNQKLNGKNTKFQLTK